MVDTLTSALAKTAWARMFPGPIGTLFVRDILWRDPIAVVLAELSGVARLVQWAFGALASDAVKRIIAGAARNFDTVAAGRVREMVMDKV